MAVLRHLSQSELAVAVFRLMTLATLCCLMNSCCLACLVTVFRVVCRLCWTVTRKSCCTSSTTVTRTATTSVSDLIFTCDAASVFSRNWSKRHSAVLKLSINSLPCLCQCASIIHEAFTFLLNLVVLHCLQQLVNQSLIKVVTINANYIWFDKIITELLWLSFLFSIVLVNPWVSAFSFAKSSLF